jgi:tRNA A-37 threonylcarbamoyl transferase component Bud32
MRDIEELVKSSKKYKNAIIQQQFKSKKNSVAYLTLNTKPRVLKWFVPGKIKQLNAEIYVLKKGSSKLNIPIIHDIDRRNNVLIMNYIIGENLCDIINNKDSTFDEKQRLIVLLSKWFFKFHNHFKRNDEFLIHGDPSLRNFIFTDRIWGVDFEESRIGKPVEDIAGMCASILSTEPMFDNEKFRLCEIFIENYLTLAPGRIFDLDDEIAYALLEKIQWRPNDEEILRKYSKLIRKKGVKKIL